MKVEPLYQLPVEEPGDVEGWSINSGQPGAILAESIAAELTRIEGDVDAFQAQLDMLPRIFQAGTVRMPMEVFVAVPNAMFNATYYRGSESIVFARQFETPPAVVILPNNSSEPGFSIECSASNVTVSGFTARLAVSSSFVGTFRCGWLAAARTQ